MNQPTVILALRHPQDAVDRIIDFVSGRRGAAHSELVFPDGSRITATLKDGFTQRPRREGYAPGPNQWTFLDLSPFTIANRIEAAKDWADAQEGCCYDRFGVCRFVLPTLLASADKFWCSEASQAAINIMCPLAFHSVPHLTAPNTQVACWDGFAQILPAYPFDAPKFDEALAKKLEWPI